MSRIDSTFSGHPTAGISECRPGLKLGPYELVELLGQGGMGAVWKAMDTQGRRSVALKFLPSDFRGNKEAMAQVRSSFQLSHALTHQHLCKVLALVDDPQHGPFLVMEFVPGITLSEYSRRFPAGRVPLPQVVSILSRVAEALDYAHQKVFQTPDGERKGVLHRDVKPQNIMLCLNGDTIADISLIDIGLAAEIRSTATRFTQARVDTRGTRPYMSPEQLSGKRSQWDGRTDQYSLGVVAYELLAGHTPFEGDDDAVLMHAIANVQPDPIGGLPGPVNAVLAKALAKKKEERFSSCSEFLSVLKNPGGVPLTPKGNSQQIGKAATEDDGLQKQAEQKVWLAAQRSDSLQGYEEYLANFSTGLHVEEAKDSRADILRRVVLELNKEPSFFQAFDRELCQAQQDYDDEIRRTQEYYEDDIRDLRRVPDFRDRMDDRKDAERRKGERIRDAARDLAGKQETIAKRRTAAQQDLTKRHAAARTAYLAVRTSKWEQRDVQDALQLDTHGTVKFQNYALSSLAVGSVLGLCLSIAGCYQGIMTVAFFFGLPLFGAVVGGTVGLVLFFKAVPRARETFQHAAMAVGPLPAGNWPSVAVARKVLLDQ